MSMSRSFVGNKCTVSINIRLLNIGLEVYLRPVVNEHMYFNFLNILALRILSVVRTITKTAFLRLDSVSVFKQKSYSVGPNRCSHLRR
jgi:hypothetical protein